MTNPQAQTTVETLRWRSERLELIDQRVLPAQIECVACDSAASVAQAIRDMVVRGAPAIGCAAAYGVALEALRHRDAEELIPLLRPVAAGLVLTGQAGTLIVRGPRARIEELRAVLATLDVPVRTLLVSLRQGSLDEIDAAGAGASGGVETGPDGAHVVGRVTVEHYGTRGRDDTVQTVRVLDGREAYIAIGRTVPVPQRYGAAVGPRGGVRVS